MCHRRRAAVLPLDVGFLAACHLGAVLAGLQETLMAYADMLLCIERQYSWVPPCDCMSAHTGGWCKPGRTDPPAGGMPGAPRSSTLSSPKLGAPGTGFGRRVAVSGGYRRWV